MEIVTREQFEAEMELMRCEKAFVFVHYKGRWVAVDYDNGIYTFYGQPRNALLAECIVKVSVPRAPESK